jgi:BirA family biotin operon repressor/biotin-[acetyl-CoA-carboxylase] ligase
MLRRMLAGLPIPAIRYFDQTGSTNDEALAWADSGAPDGALVAADSQTAGRGRLARRWVTHPGAALACSLILRPHPWEIDRVGLFSPLGALAVAEALEKEFALQPRIKWPNDVLLDGRKVCGILLDASWLGDQLAALVIGIGVNVLAAAVPPPEELLFPATSVESALGRAVAREDLLRSVLASFFAWREKIASAEFLAAWDQRLAYRGERVEIEQAGAAPLTGTVLGVRDTGALRLRIASGDEILVIAGDVRLRPGDQNPCAHLGESSC